MGCPFHTSVKGMVNPGQMLVHILSRSIQMSCQILDTPAQFITRFQQSLIIGLKPFDTTSNMLHPLRRIILFC
jgi:hypothetical protein